LTEVSGRNVRKLDQVGSRPKGGFLRLRVLAISADIADAYGAKLILGQSPLGGLEAVLAFETAGRRKRRRDPV
jgi:hypothetical protein